MYKKHFVTALVLASGMGQRMGIGKNKLLLELSGKSILSYTAKKFYDNPLIDEIIITASETDFDTISSIISEECLTDKVRLIKGGKTRQESSYLAICEAKDGIVLIHDGARPFVSDEMIKEAVSTAVEFGASAPGIVMTDTVKKVVDGFIEKTVPRDELVRIQTPQAFFKAEILKAHEKAMEKGLEVTDDAMLFELMGKKVRLIKGSADNIKITTREDLDLANEIIKR